MGEIINAFNKSEGGKIEVLPWVVERNRLGKPIPIRQCTPEELEEYYDVIGVPQIEWEIE